MTATVAAEQELAHSRQFLLAITNNMAEGMIATDGQRHHDVRERGRGRLLGRDAAELVGQHRPSKLSGSSTRTAHLGDEECPLERGLGRGGESLNVEHDTLIRRGRNSVPVAYNASPLRADGLSGAVIVFEDITERAAEQLRVERELEKLTWVGRIRDALDNGRFVLYAQPIIDLSDVRGRPARTADPNGEPEGEIVPPDSFLPTAEEFGLITEIDRWVVHETARSPRSAHAVEFNLSAKSVVDPDMLDARCATAIEDHRATPPTSCARSPRQHSCATSPPPRASSEGSTTSAARSPSTTSAPATAASRT